MYDKPIVGASLAHVMLGPGTDYVIPYTHAWLQLTSTHK